MPAITIDVDLPPGVTITAYERHADGHGFEVSWPLPDRCRCDRCGREDKAALEFRDKVQVVRDLDLWGQPSFWAYQPAFHRCPWCAHRQFLIPPFKRKDASYTYRFEQQVLRLLIGSNETEVARRLGISAETVAFIVRNQLADAKAKQVDPGRVLTDVGIDELSLKKRHRLYVTLLTDLTNPDRPEVLAVAEGRDEAAARTCLEKLSADQRQQVQTYRADMGPAFHKACRVLLPNARPVIDRFHVAKLFNEAIDGQRKKNHAGVQGEALPGGAEGFPVVDVGVPPRPAGTDDRGTAAAGTVVREAAAVAATVRPASAVQRDFRPARGSSEGRPGTGGVVPRCHGSVPRLGGFRGDLRAVAGGDPELLRRPANECSGGGDQQQGAGDPQTSLRAEVRRQPVDAAHPRPEPRQRNRGVYDRAYPGASDGPSGRFLPSLHLNPEDPKVLTAKIASGEWDGIIVTHSSFERIGMSRDYQEKFLLEQIAEYDQLLREHAGAKGANRNLIKTIEKQKAARAERLKDLLAEDKKDDGLVFDELGVDHIFIDEAHYFKNLETPTKMDRVSGIQTGGSERAFDVYMKARYLDAQHAGHGVTFATGTPISNTMVEMYTMQQFLDPEGLRSRGLEHFDAWAATFGEVIDTMEISPDGAGLRPRSRFARFTNLPELQQMFRAFSDVQTAEMLNLPRPRLETGKPIIVACPMSDEQYALQQELVERYDRLRSQKVDPRVDNALSITTDGRKLATDARMLSATAPDFPESKVNRLVENVAVVWERTAPTRGTQMIFADMGVNPTAWGYSPYDEIITKLVAHGIPREQIAAIGDAESDAKKQALFEKVRNGSVRVLIGSTQKMGTGTNVQKRLVALHHLDAPWKPAEVEQRDGRILREGNENEEVAIYRYVTEGSFDAYMWQALETKARFISQVITGDNAARRAEDIGSQELSYAEVKAIASGNPAVLTLAEADAELQRLTLLKKNHLDEQYVARRSVRDLPGTNASLSERLSKLSADEATAKARAGDSITISGRKYAREDAPAVLTSQLDTMPHNVRDTTRIPLGIYRGLRFGMVLHPQFPPDVYLEGAITRQSGLSREHQGPRAVLNALERLATAYGPECERVRQDIGIAESQLRDYQAQLGKPFTLDAYLFELTALRDQLKAGLSGAAHQSDKEEGPTVSEMAEKIKALKAANNIEATPQRVRQKHSTAEEPVTARIRRRTEVIAASAPQIESEAASAAGAAQPPAQDSSNKPQMTFQERVAMERRPKEPEPDLS